MYKWMQGSKFRCGIVCAFISSLIIGNSWFVPPIARQSLCDWIEKSCFVSPVYIALYMRENSNSKCQGPVRSANTGGSICLIISRELSREQHRNTFCLIIFIAWVTYKEIALMQSHFGVFFARKNFYTCMHKWVGAILNQPFKFGLFSLQQIDRESINPYNSKG